MITAAYSQFFSDLAQNNEREWFQANKKRYEQHVKKPFTQLIDTLIPQIQELDKDIIVQAKDTLFRINRDVRFSKDKTPYNVIMKAGLAAGGRKSELPGFYLGIDANEIHVGGGMFGVSTERLQKIRAYLVANQEEFLEIISAEPFVSHFANLLGERLKRAPKGFDVDINAFPFVLNKQFYAMARLNLAEYIDKPDLDKILFNYFKQINPLNDYLKSALN